MEGPYDIPCPGCEGTGRVVVRAWADWLAAYRRIEFGTADPVARLDALIEHVRAQPDQPQISMRPCPQCDGDGYLLTPAGRELLEFLQRNLPELIDRHLRRTRHSSAERTTERHGGHPTQLRPV